MFDFRRIKLFCLEKRLSKHKMTICSKHLGSHGPFGPPGYAHDPDRPGRTSSWPSENAVFYRNRFQLII